MTGTQTQTEGCTMKRPGKHVGTYRETSAPKHSNSDIVRTPSRRHAEKCKHCQETVIHFAGAMYSTAKRPKGGDSVICVWSRDEKHERTIG